MTGTDKLLTSSLQNGHRLIEWEPYKAAIGNGGFQKSQPLIPSKLVAYEISADIPPKCRPNFIEFPQINDNFHGRNILENPNTLKSTIKIEEDDQSRMGREIETLRRELEVAHEVNNELKRLLVNALSEDMNCQISGLAEDKVRLAKNIDTYYNRAKNDAENQENLSIQSALWKSKFLAIAIRADDLSYNLNVALKLFKKAQNVISDLSKNVQLKSGDLAKAISDLLQVNVLSLYNKSPCDNHQKQPFTSSLTITCCSRCADKEIKLV